MATSIPSRNGLFINQLNGPFTHALSASVVGSTHFLLTDGIYVVWASAPFLLFLTDPFNDPPAIPTSPGSNYPGVLWPANTLFEFMMDGAVQVTFGVITTTPTGVRMVQATGTAGNFFFNVLGDRVN